MHIASLRVISILLMCQRKTQNYKIRITKKLYRYLVLANKIHLRVQFYLL